MLPMFLDMFRKKEEPYVSILDGTDDTTVPVEGSGFKVSIVSDVGFVRQKNEDSFYADGIGIKPKENCSLKMLVSDDERRIFAVCDGMGGEAFGELASEISVSTLYKKADELRYVDICELRHEVNVYADDANRNICDMTRQKNCGRSGSTLAMVCIDNGIVHSFNIGDSRIYYFHDGTISHKSQDHTLAAQKLRAGVYSEDEARISTDSHRLITFLGVDDDGVGLIAYSYGPFELADGKILICSDGLTDMCLDYEIAKVLSEEHDSYAEALMLKALEKGGWDNITCMVIEAMK